MVEATNQYSREHPSHPEPDRYKDDEGRCVYCGMMCAERDLRQAEARYEAALICVREIAEGGWVVDITAQEHAKQFLTEHGGDESRG